MRKFSIAGLLISVIALMAGCADHKSDRSEPGRRIVSLSKQLTEMVFALGEGHNLVACDLTSNYPDSTRFLTKVGYHRALNPEGIIAMNPDLVIHSNDIGPANVLPQITEAGLNIKAFGGANSIDSAEQLIIELGKFFGKQARADSIVKKMESDLARAASALQAMNLKDTPTVMIIHFGRANNVYFVMSGRNGVGDKMIELAGGKPASYNARGARQLSAEAIAEANPDIIIATDYGYDQMGSMDKFIAGIPGVALTNAGKNRRIVRFEEHDLVYFGPRSGENIIKLMNLLHPDAKPATP